MLESCESIGKSKWHDKPLEGTIVGAESGFPFITFCDVDKVIGMLEINGGVDMGFTCSGMEIGNEGKRILVLLKYFIEASVIYAEVEGFVFLESKDHIRKT